MGVAHSYDTKVDEYVRRTGMTRKAFAVNVGIATSTLYKARALNPLKGGVHWQTLAVIGAYMGLIANHEEVSPKHPIVKLLGRELVSARGRGTPRYNDVFGSYTPRKRHLRLVA